MSIQPESPGKKKKQRTGKGALARRKERKRRGKAGLIAKVRYKIFLSIIDPAVFRCNASLVLQFKSNLRK